jgi:hypothetical protein
MSPLRGRRRTSDRNGSGRSYAFATLTPIRPDGVQALAEELARFADGESPFRRVTSAHFARWLVIDGLKMGWPGAPRRPTRLSSSYLLFTAMVTAPEGVPVEAMPARFLVEVAERMPAEADAVWRNCYGYPGVDGTSAFADYLIRGQLDTELFYVGYADVTAAEVRSAVDAAEGFLSFAAAHQGSTDAAALQQAFVEESPSWGN